MDHIEIIGREAARLAAVLVDAQPDSTCPTCPEFSAADLLWHLTSVHFFWAEILSRRVQDAADLPAIEAAKPDRPATMADMVPILERSTGSMLTALAAYEDSQACWSWWPADQTVGFSRRMQTYEATMHRVDAELVAGLPVGPIADDVAAGAVDHAVDVMWGWPGYGETYRADAVVELIATDTGQTWLVEAGSWWRSDGQGPFPKGVRATTGDPEATVRAPVLDLALWAWTRGGSVRVSGTPAARTALDAVLAKGIVG
ncbi:maleylpyruvate isomerase family mycothiol-dependent enzyme [Mycobacterium sp. NPDC003449]